MLRLEKARAQGGFRCGQTGQVVRPLQVAWVHNMGTEFTNPNRDSQAVSCVEGISEQVGSNDREATVAVVRSPIPARRYPAVSAYFSPTPTAAPAADQSTILPALLVHPSLALPTPYPPARTSDTTSTRLSLNA
jgi:hypothetical protein